MNHVEAFFKLSYGMYLVTCSSEDKKNAYVANTAFQVTSQPPRLAISCNKSNYSAELIEEGRAFGISVLQKDTPIDFIRQFGYQSGKDIPKFKGLNYKKGITGAPVVYDYSVAWFECRVVDKVDIDTHWLFVGEIIDYGLLSNTEIPLDYAWYRDAYKAASPAKAPTFVPTVFEEVHTDQIDSRYPSFRCSICEYLYDPAKGDPAHNIPPGTPFTELPEEWVCPVCGATKTMFSEM